MRFSNIFIVLNLFFLTSCSGYPSYKYYNQIHKQLRIEEEKKIQEKAKKMAENKKYAEEIRIQRRHEIETIIKKDEEDLKKRYQDEYLNNETFGYIVLSKNYDSLIEAIHEELKKTYGEKVKFSKINCDNTFIAALCCTDIRKSLSVLTTIIESINDDKYQNLIKDSDGFSLNRDCVKEVMNQYYITSIREKNKPTYDENRKKYEEALRGCGLNNSDSISGLTVSPTYLNILAEKERLNCLYNHIYDKAYQYEFDLFSKLTGYIYHSTQNTLENNLSSLLFDGNWEPTSGFLYSLHQMNVFQSIEGGVLIRSNIIIPGYDNKTFFLYTNKNFVDGQTLQGLYAYFVGIKKYQSLVGQRNVYAFKVYATQNNQNINGTQFYFYPNIIDVRKLDKNIIKNALGAKKTE